ncbi:MAG TPA: vWA domain-containing protein, partial [Sphingomonas sp.]|nr:vWA domain-containing protein [Sphingomonas sp.]
DVLDPIAWGCGALNGFPPAPATQAILDVHMNWHCSFDDTINQSLGRFANDGNKFFGFHRQFIYAFNRYRQSQGVPFVQTWMPFSGASIPFGHGGRADGAACGTCSVLPNSKRLPSAGGTLNPAVTTMEDYGNGLVPWHNNQHVALSDSGVASDDDCVASHEILCVTTAPADPMFFRFHNFVNDLQDEILTYQDTDVMIVFDRSGSMTLPTSVGGNRLDAAKNAAQLFADLLRDASNHRVGLVSFSTSAAASPELPLTLAASAPAAMTTALGGISANGSTSIGDGLRAAMVALNASSNPHKAILLLTDGMENTAPMIANQVGRTAGKLVDTHLCAVGFGTPGSLDGPKLRDLAELQGGVYLSDADPLNLKKYFVECFADIFDTFVGKDPIANLAANRNASDPVVHMAESDGEVTFTLAWDDPLPHGTLRLAVTSPSGAPVNLGDPGIESRFGPSWHIVRVKLPYASEQPGGWTARVVRPMRSFVNGFLPTAFADPEAGTLLVQQQIAQLCPDGCARVLYYEDFPPSKTHGAHNSVYFAALMRAKVTHSVGAIDRASDPALMQKLLERGRYDLIVASIGYSKDALAFDALLSEQACSERVGARIILSDRRKLGATLRCLGAMPVDEMGYKKMTGDGQIFSGPVEFQAGLHGMHAMAGMAPDTFALKSTGAAGATVGATTPGGNAAIISRGRAGPAQRYFIEALASGAARVRPFTWRSPNYTLESLHPTFHIPEIHMPIGGFDSIKARVAVTRPLVGLGSLMARANPREAPPVAGDPLSPRQIGALRMDSKQNGQLIKTETVEFPLFDDGTHGDTSKDDRYWENALPPGFAQFDGQYTFHAFFTLCRNGHCIDREATQTVAVDVKLDRTATVVAVQPRRRGLVQVVLTPMDSGKTLLGPGRQDVLQVALRGQGRVQSAQALDGKGAYGVTVQYDPASPPTLLVSQFGRPQDPIEVKLP